MPNLATVKDYRVIIVALTMSKNLKHHPTIEELAQSVNLNVNQLELLFKEELQCCPSQYLSQLRLEKACFLLVNTELRVCQIMRQVGFQPTRLFFSNFSRNFRLYAKGISSKITDVTCYIQFTTQR